MAKSLTEISRLQHSLQALGSTQTQLQEAIVGEVSPDPELEQALQENSIVIASQEERIVMLRKALEAQGAAIADNPHYDIQQPPVPAPARLSQPATSTSPNESVVAPSTLHQEDDSEGVYL
ncbi:hypothetical protein FRC12_019111 [Ceratobasidium sp. 428]|nr:hypothetical protein FRC09_013273 [Ceratobasidium sp. 395]KAG8732863.1 hypothetical protein FRC12_019111 [Ceratobasidium sp. 428]